MYLFATKRFITNGVQKNGRLKKKKGILSLNDKEKSKYLESRDGS